MQRFYLIKEGKCPSDGTPYKFVIHCPYCRAINRFLTQLKNNVCGHCGVEMPFLSSMADKPREQIEYHLEEVR